MIIHVDLEEIKRLNLSPTEFVVLKLIETNNIIEYPHVSDKLLSGLIEKGWLDNSKRLIRKLEQNETNIQEWIKLWPTFLMPEGYRVSGNTVDCVLRMQKFMKKYKFSWDTIMQATKNYLDRQTLKNWRMTKKNVKFIYDENGSALAEECEVVLSGESKNSTENTLFI
jgi:hypothetical protein